MQCQQKLLVECTFLVDNIDEILHANNHALLIMIDGRIIMSLSLVLLCVHSNLFSSHLWIGIIWVLPTSQYSVPKKGVFLDKYMLEGEVMLNSQMVCSWWKRIYVREITLKIKLQPCLCPHLNQILIIHPSIIFYLSGVWSQRQQAKQRGS